MSTRSNKIALSAAIILLSLTLLACQLAAQLLPQISVQLPGSSESAANQQPVEGLPEGHPALDSGIPARSGEDLSQLFAPFWEAWDIVHEQYVDQPVDDEAMMEGAAKGMLEAFQYTQQTTFEALTIPNSEETGTPPELEELFTPFWKAWVYAHEPDDQALVYGAIRGMLDSLGDPHTSYMDPDQFTQANIPLDGTYEGIGAWVDPNREYLTIVSPMDGSPAAEAGLLPGDEIIAVDGEDMTGIDGNLVIRKVLGPAGSKVILTIRREGVAEPFDVEITRARITIPSVESRMLDNQVGYVKLLTFGDDSRDELRKALEKLLEEQPVGIVFDLRNNGGGYLSSAIEVASEFIEDGVIMYEDYGDGERDTYYADGQGIATQIPLVVLVNEGTASASEIVAGAIQDYGRAPLVGTITFGKGSVQNWIPLSNNQGAVRVTIARWLTPKERLIHEVGLTPDYPLAVITQEALDNGFDIESFGLPEDQIVILSAEDVQNSVDPQLDLAVEVLLDSINK